MSVTFILHGPDHPPPPTPSKKGVKVWCRGRFSYKGGGGEGGLEFFLINFFKVYHFYI